ncbi:MAG: hypothetical protein U1F34_05975 [Gammaproteobacteria bacterium]
MSVIDLATNTVQATIDVGTQPRGIGKSPDGSELYVALGEEGKIAVIDPKTKTVRNGFRPGSGSLWGASRRQHLHFHGGRCQGRGL